MEEAIYLTRFASKVTVVHRRDTLRASKIMQDKAFKNPKIEFIWDSEVADVLDEGKGEVTGIVVRNLKSGQLRPRCPWTACSSPSATRRIRRSSQGRSSSTPTGKFAPTTARRPAAGGVCGGGRPGSRLPAGDHRGRLRLHGRDRRRALRRRTVGSSSTGGGTPDDQLKSGPRPLSRGTDSAAEEAHAVRRLLSTFVDEREQVGDEAVRVFPVNGMPDTRIANQA